MADFNFNTIQSRIDTIYNSKWLQPNAFYPTKLFFTDKNTSESIFTVDEFLRLHNNNTNNSTLINSTTTQYESKTVPKTLEEYKKLESELSGIDAPEKVLAYFSKLSNLNSFSIPISKTNGSLTASSVQSKDPTVTLEFLWDQSMEVLKYLQAWQSRWLTQDWQKITFVDKQYSDSMDSSVSKEGGEGYLGLANCSIDTNGTVTVISQLSLFGLIPTKIETFNDVGPQNSSTNIQKIKVTCTYAHAILAYPNNNGSLNFFYFA